MVALRATTHCWGGACTFGLRTSSWSTSTSAAPVGYVLDLRKHDWEGNPNAIDEDRSQISEIGGILRSVDDAPEVTNGRRRCGCGRCCSRVQSSTRWRTNRPLVAARILSQTARHRGHCHDGVFSRVRRRSAMFHPRYLYDPGEPRNPLALKRG
jgi:hypothetical protein